MKAASEGPAGEPRGDESVAGPAQQLCRALVLSPVQAPAALAAALDLVGAGAPVFKTSLGSALYVEVPYTPTSEDEFAVLLGEPRPLPGELVEKAQLVSKLAKGGAVVVASWVREGEEGLAGDVVAKRFVSGASQDDLPGGVVASRLDVAAEEVLLGRRRVEDAGTGRSGGGWFRRGPAF